MCILGQPCVFALVNCLSLTGAAVVPGIVPVPVQPEMHLEMQLAQKPLLLFQRLQQLQVIQFSVTRSAGSNVFFLTAVGTAAGSSVGAAAGSSVGTAGRPVFLTALESAVRSNPLSIAGTPAAIFS